MAIAISDNHRSKDSSRTRRSGGPWLAALLTALFTMAGCVHTVTHSSGMIVPARNSKSIAAPASTAKPPTPDDALRQTFEEQTRGAFNPLTDDRTVQSLKTRLRMDPRDVAARLQLAATYERYRLDEEALTEYKQALSFVGETPESGSAVNGQRAEAAAEGLARCSRETGHSPDAVPVLAAFVRRTPTSGAWNELGALYDDGGDLAAGEEAFREAVALAPGSDLLHNNLGYNLLLQKKTEAGEAEFRKALELNPKSATARNNLGEVLAQRGDLDGAFQEFRMASADIATAHNNLAVVLLEMGRYEHSRDELVKALSARYYFAPPIENFKLVQELLRQRADIFAAGASLPLRTVSVPPSLLLAMGRLEPLVDQERRPAAK